MNKRNLLLSLAVALGSYLYGVAGNLYNKLPLGESLTSVEWKRAIFIGVFCYVVVPLFQNRKGYN